MSSKKKFDHMEDDPTVSEDYGPEPAVTEKPKVDHFVLPEEAAAQILANALADNPQAENVFVNQHAVKFTTLDHDFVVFVKKAAK